MDYKLPHGQASVCQAATLHVRRGDKQHRHKFSDDSSIVGCITDNREEEYRELVENFMGWCDGNHLQIKTGKTMELVVDFRRRKSTLLQHFSKKIVQSRVAFNSLYLL